MKPRLLDLFCGAGGAAMGYHRAGFEVVGVDIKPQPHYPFEFHQADALTYPLEGFDAYHASPPCQGYSSMRFLGKGAGKAPKLVTEVRALLVSTGRPYVIENVIGAPLMSPIKLCGSMFGLSVRRHRLFETTVFLLSPRCNHGLNEIAVYGDHPEDCFIHRSGEFIKGGVRRAKDIETASQAMGIDWMDWKEITQAIPPAYTEFIGKYLMQAVMNMEGI
ncbi:MAG: DNA cytosine methyltransferase [Sphaerochaeta sp.]|jgi:DNA (cytosine-5)-methyltransferase 1|nr:DNA cytosine methyltransferase [Sphaerochaeta sp.]